MVKMRKRKVEIVTLQSMGRDGFPKFVGAELRNWARAEWSGAWPQPLPPTACGSAERYAPSGIDREDIDRNDAPKPVPIHYENARRVRAIYDALPLDEQRVMQEEYTRLGEYPRSMSVNARQNAASRKIGISVTYYKIALNSIKSLVLKEFSR